MSSSEGCSVGRRDRRRDVSSPSDRGLWSATRRAKNPATSFESDVPLEAAYAFVCSIRSESTRRVSFTGVEGRDIVRIRIRLIYVHAIGLAVSLIELLTGGVQHTLIPFAPRPSSLGRTPSYPTDGELGTCSPEKASPPARTGTGPTGCRPYAWPAWHRSPRLRSVGVSVA